MTEKMQTIITIDGPASSGKSALSRSLSKKLGWSWFSTGVLYRGMAYVSLQEKFKPEEFFNFFKSEDWRIELSDSLSRFFLQGPRDK